MIDATDLACLVDGSCSPETAVEIQNWVAADPRRADLLDELRAMWLLTGRTSVRWNRAAARTRLTLARARLAERTAATADREEIARRTRTTDGGGRAR